MSYAFLLYLVTSSLSLTQGLTQSTGGSARQDEGSWRTAGAPNGGEVRYLLPTVSSRDYPENARDAGIEGTSVVRLEVDPHGRIVDCRAVRSAGLPELDEAACRIYRSRGRFQLRNIAHNIVLHGPVTWQLQDSAEDSDPMPRGRPAELLQADGCERTARLAAELQRRGLSLVDVEAVPSCLAPAFRSLAARALAIAGDPDARVVVRARVGRAFSEASMYYSSPTTRSIHMPQNIQPILDVLSSEWENYVSPDGDLGWSGFLLVVDEGRTRIRLLADEPSPGDIWLHSNRIREEFFQGMLFPGDR